MYCSRFTLAVVFLPVLFLPTVCPALFAQEKDRAMELYYSANALYNRKLYSLAAEEYEKFLKQYAGHEKASQSRMGLALCRYALDDRKKAEPLFAELAGDRRLENRQEMYNLWGQCLLALDRQEEAEQAFAWSAAHGSDKEQAHHGEVGRIEAQYRQRRWKDVAANSDRFRGRYSDSPHLERVNFQGAVARFELGRFDEARQLLAELADPREKTPFMQHVFFLLAECHRELGQDEEALRHYQTAARRIEGAFTADALYRLGFVRFTNKAYTDAARDFVELIENCGASENAPAARLYLGRCLLENGNHQQAEKVFATFTPSSKRYGEARLWYARSLIGRNQPERAEELLAETLKGVKDSPVRPDLLFEYAHVRLGLGRHDEAGSGFGRIAARWPDHALAPGARWLQAYCLHKAGRFEQSLEQCQSFLSRYPKSDRRPEVLFLAAENRFLLDRLDEAEPLYLDFIAAFDDHFYRDSAQYRVAQIQYRQKRWKKALAAIEPLQERRSDSPFFSQLLYIQGDCHFNLKQWNGAVDAFLLFTREQPDAPNRDSAAFKTALALESMGEGRKALSALESFVKRFGDSGDLAFAFVELGRMRYEAGEYDKARRAFERAREVGEAPEAAYYLGYVALAEGKPEAAARHFQEVWDGHPDHELAADALLQRAVLVIRAGDHAMGRDLLKRFLAEHEAHDKADQAQFYLGFALAREKQWEDAIEAFQAVLNRFDDSSFCDRALYEWAWCEKGRNRKDLAARRYEAFLQGFSKSPLAPEVRFELAELDAENKQYDAAIQRLDALLEEDLDPALRERALYRLGWNHFLKKDYPNTARCFETLLEAFPDSSRRSAALYQAGEARLKSKEHEEAYHHFRGLVDLKREDPYAEQTLLRLGECAALTGRWQESEAVYRRFISEYPESKFVNRVLFGQGWALENQERYREALGIYRQVVDRGNHDEITARSQFQIGECCFAMKNYDEAVKALIKVEILYAYPKWSSKALLETGRVLDLLGKKEQALERYQELIRKYPEDDAATVARKKLEDA